MTGLQGLHHEEHSTCCMADPVDMTSRDVKVSSDRKGFSFSLLHLLLKACILRHLEKFIKSEILISKLLNKKTSLIDTGQIITPIFPTELFKKLVFISASLTHTLQVFTIL